MSHSSQPSPHSIHEEEINSSPIHELEINQVIPWNDLIDKHLELFNWRAFLEALLIAMPMFFDAQQAFLSIYTEHSPQWHCTTPSTSCNITSDICKIPRSSWSWDYKPSSIISEFGLECASPFILGLPLFSFFFGCLLGSFSLSALADSFLGRKNLLVLSSLMMSSTSLVLLLATNIWVYSVIKVFIGFWRSTIGTCVLVLLTEKVGGKWRIRIGLLEFLCFNLGYMSLPGLGYFLRHSSWKYIHVWSALPCMCLAVITFFFVSESPRWLLMHGKEKELIAMLRNTEVSFSNVSSLPMKVQENVSVFHLLTSVRTLFKDRWTCRRSISVMALGIGIGGVYYGIPLAVGTLGFNIYLAALLTASMEIPSFVATYFMEGLNRKPSIFVFSTLGGLCSIMCVVVGNHTHIKMVFGMAAFFCATMSYNIFLVYIIELFPTSMRNTATAVVRQAIVAVCMVCPFLIKAGINNSWFSYGGFGILIICSNLALPFVPETKGGILCDTLAEQQEKEGEINSSTYWFF